MFVKAMTAEFKIREPDSKQADNMRKIGELWRQMSEEEKAKWLVDGEAEPAGDDVSARVWVTDLLPAGHAFNISRKSAKRRAVQSSGDM